MNDSAMRQRSGWKNLRENIMHGVFLVCALASILAVALICVFLFANGLPAMREIGFLNFLTGTSWRPGNDIYGILPMIVGSIYITAGAIVIGVPIGLLTAIFMAFYCPKRIYGILKPCTELLAGIPSIVYGFFGMVVIAPTVLDIAKFFGADISSGATILSAAILLGIMILPTIIGVSEAALRAVPNAYYEGAVAMGATHERRGVLGHAAGGKVRRAGGYRARHRPRDRRDDGGHHGRGQPAASDRPTFSRASARMTANIVIEMGYATGLHREALIATGVVLFVFILLINLCFSVLKRRKDA